ncbi:LptF/LptG family permease [Glycocaulis profundi]|nr:LptF/LptG family permease [Glycocaulis profundi]
MNLFQRYAFRQAFWPFLAALAALTGLAVLTQSLSNLDLIADRGETALVFLWVTILALPQVMALLLPIAVFIACAIAANRLTSDSELTVVAAAGMSRRQRLGPFMRLGVYALLANLAINLFVQPAAYREMRRAVFEIRTDVAASFMRPGEFVPLGAGTTFYARTISDTGLMSDVFIEDGRGETAIAYSARRGMITATERGPVMLLENGIASQIGEGGAMASLAFERYEFDLGAFIDLTAAFSFKESDKYLPELLDPSPADIVRARGEGNLYAEGHYRLSAPLYNLAFALIAVSAYLGAAHRRTGYGRQLVIAGACAMLLRLGGFAAQAAATNSPELNTLQYALPILGIAGAWIVIHKPGRFAVRGPKTSRRSAPAGAQPA